MLNIKKYDFGYEEFIWMGWWQNTTEKGAVEREERSIEIIQTKREEKVKKEKVEQSIHDINRIKDKNHMIISTDAEKKNHITKLNT